METMTIRYNPANAFVQSLVNLIRQTKAIRIISDSRVEAVPNAATLAAIEEVKRGGLKTYNNVDEMMHDILG